MSKDLGAPRKDNSTRNILLILMLMLGIVIGGLAATYLVYPGLNADSVATIQDLTAKNQVVEKEAQTYLQCLNIKGVDVQSCPVVR